MKMTMGLLFAAAIALAASVPTQAAKGRQGAKAAPTKTIWDGVYTTQQADRGAEIYGRECSICHRDDLKGGGKAKAPALVGPPFLKKWNGSALTELFGLMAQKMARDSTDYGGGRPHDLPLDEFVDIVAHVLRSNHAAPGPSELGTDAGLDVVTITAKAPKR